MEPLSLYIFFCYRKVSESSRILRKNEENLLAWLGWMYYSWTHQTSQEINFWILQWEGPYLFICCITLSSDTKIWDIKRGIFADTHLGKGPFEYRQRSLETSDKLVNYVNTIKVSLSIFPHRRSEKFCWCKVV